MDRAPYVFFHGNCAEALAFYEAAGLGTVEMQTPWSQGPADMPKPPNRDNKIMHGRFAGDRAALACDSPQPGEGYKGFAPALGLSDEAKTEKLFADLSAGGTVTMAMEKTFWGAYFGMFTDKFGVGWMINCEVKQ